MKIKISAALLLVSMNCYSESIFIVPGKNWGFKFNSPILVEQTGRSNGKEYQLTGGTDVGFNISAFVEPALGKGKSAQECQTYYWDLTSKNPDIRKETVADIGTEQFPAKTYISVTSYKGKKYLLTNTNYYGFRENNCIDVHISQTFQLDEKVNYDLMLEFHKSFNFYK